MSWHMMLALAALSPILPLWALWRLDRPTPQRKEEAPVDVPRRTPPRSSVRDPHVRGLLQTPSLGLDYATILSAVAIGLFVVALTIALMG